MITVIWIVALAIIVVGALVTFSAKGKSKKRLPIPGSEAGKPRASGEGDD
jgi:hypothetical protein